MSLKVSIVIPALNEERRIASAVHSAQRTGATEVIVVDGGSSDETKTIAAMNGCRVLSSGAGRATQQNVGAKAATGDVLLFQHADCQLPSDGVTQIKVACQDPQVMFGAFYQQIDATGWIYSLLASGNAARVRWFGLAYGDQGIFVRRDIFEQIGGFPEQPLMEDVGLMKRLRHFGRPALLAGPIGVSSRRWQQRGVVTQTARNWCLLAAFCCGVSPSQLQKFYPRHDSA